MFMRNNTTTISNIEITMKVKGFEKLVRSLILLNILLRKYLLF